MKINYLLMIVIALPVYLFSPISGISNQLNDLESEYHEHLADFFHNSREVPGHLDLALKNYLKVQKTSILWKISRCYWLLGEAAVSSSNKIKYFEQGYIYGEKALEADENIAESHLWYALSFGSLALEKGIMKTIYQKDVIKAALEKTISLNKKNIDAYLGLATWYFYVPEILGGSKSKSFQILNKAISIDHNYTMAYFVKADFLKRTQQNKQAKKVLKALLNIKTPSSVSGGIQDKANAVNLLSKL
jgi:tetratricopeptide (TPR) repeat protein